LSVTGSYRMAANPGPQKHMVDFDLQEALAQPGCAICRLATRDVSRYLQSLLALVNDVKMRQELRMSGGLCREHAWQAAALGSRLSVYILWCDLVSAALGGLQHAIPRPRDAGQGGCMVCRRHAKATGIYCDVLVRHLERGGLRGDYAASAGLCVPHLWFAMTRAGAAAKRFLLETERSNLERLQADLQEVIRKNDYRFHNEPWGPERDAWRRATAKLAGENSIRMTD